MKISPTYGPQFDPADGTIGETQLVQRWRVVHDTEHGEPFTPSQGRYTYATRKEALDGLNIIVQSNNVSTLAVHAPDGLRVAPVWCYPGHFDPVAPVQRDPAELVQLVADYLREIEEQSPIVHTSHHALRRIRETYSSEAAQAEIDRQLGAAPVID